MAKLWFLSIKNNRYNEIFGHLTKKSYYGFAVYHRAVSSNRKWRTLRPLLVTGNNFLKNLLNTNKCVVIHSHDIESVEGEIFLFNW